MLLYLYCECDECIITNPRVARPGTGIRFGIGPEPEYIGYITYMLTYYNHTRAYNTHTNL